jgi:PEP-CTERM motif
LATQDHLKEFPVKFVKHLMLAGLLAASFSASAAPGPITVCVDDAAGGFSLGTAQCAVDGGANDMLAAVNGMVQFNYVNWGNFTITTETATGAPLLTGFHFDGLLTSFNGGAVILAVTQTGLTGANGPTVFASSIGGNLGYGATLAYDVWVDDADASFGQGAHIASFTGFGTQANSADVSGTYSMSAFATLSHPAAWPNAVVSSFNASTTVPEPGALALVGLALAGAGMAGRRQQKRQSV